MRALFQTNYGAGDGNRTHVISLEGWSSTIELHPQITSYLTLFIFHGGGGRIRTSEGGAVRFTV